MRRRVVLTVFLLLAVVIPMTTASVEAGLREKLTELASEAIRNLPLDASDLVAALGLRCSPVKGLVNLDLRLTPISLQKLPGKIEFVNLTTIRAMAAFEFMGHYDLLLNTRSVRANDIKMIGEGAINISFKGLKIRIEDIPSLVLKLADRQGECPNIGQIKRNPKSLGAGGTYEVATTVESNSPGHIAYFLFANNKAVQSADPTLRTILGTKRVDYMTPLVLRDDAAPDNYYGNVMAVEIVSKNKNPLDFKSYDVLFTTGITMVTVK